MTSYLEIIPKDILRIILQKYIQLRNINIINLKILVDIYNNIKEILSDDYFYTSMLLIYNYDVDIKIYIIKQYNDNKINDWLYKYNIYLRFINAFYIGEYLYKSFLEEKTTEYWGYAIKNFNIEILNIHFLDFNRLLYINNLSTAHKLLINYNDITTYFNFNKLPNENSAYIVYAIDPIPSLNIGYTEYITSISFSQLKYLLIVFIYNNIDIYDVYGESIYRTEIDRGLYII